LLEEVMRWQVDLGTPPHESWSDFAQTEQDGLDAANSNGDRYAFFIRGSGKQKHHYTVDFWKWIQTNTTYQWSDGTNTERNIKYGAREVTEIFYTDGNLDDPNASRPLAKAKPAWKVTEELGTSSFEERSQALKEQAEAERVQAEKEASGDVWWCTKQCRVNTWCRKNCQLEWDHQAFAIAKHTVLTLRTHWRPSQMTTMTILRMSGQPTTAMRTRILTCQG